MYILFCSIFPIFPFIFVTNYSPWLDFWQFLLGRTKKDKARTINLKWIFLSIINFFFFFGFSRFCIFAYILMRTVLPTVCLDKHMKWKKEEEMEDFGNAWNHIYVSSGFDIFLAFIFSFDMHFDSTNRKMII